MITTMFNEIYFIFFPTDGKLIVICIVCFPKCAGTVDYTCVGGSERADVGMCCVPIVLKILTYCYDSLIIIYNHLTPAKHHS